MSGPSWVQTEERLVKRPLQEPLNLYVHPETTPELEERLLRDSAAQALSLQYNATNCTAGSLDSLPNGGLDPRKDYNYEVHPSIASSPSVANRESRVIALSTAGRSTDSYDGQHSSLMGCSDSHSLHHGTGLITALEQEPLPRECTVSFREHLSRDSTDVSPPQQRAKNFEPQNQLQNHQEQQPQQQEQLSGLSERPWPAQSTYLHTPDPDGGGTAPSLPGSFEPMQAEYVSYKSPSTCHTRDAPGPGELVSMHSLSLSGPDRDLLDQLLGSEPGGANSPPLAAPSSYLASGPFGEVALQPAFSDYSQRPTPATMADHEAEADSTARRQRGRQHVFEIGGRNGDYNPHPPLLTSYSEPLPFSATMPQHLNLHPPCPSGLATPCRNAAIAGRGSNSHICVGSPTALYVQPNQKVASAEAGLGLWGGIQDDGKSGCELQGPPKQEPQLAQTHPQVVQTTQQQQPMHQQQPAVQPQRHLQVQDQHQPSAMQMQQHARMQQSGQMQMLQQQQPGRHEQLGQLHSQQPIQMQMEQEQIQQSPPYQRPQSASQTSAYGISQSMNSVDEQAVPLTAVHSAPMPGAQPRHQKPNELVSTCGAFPPMNMDGSLRAQGYTTISSAGGTAAAAVAGPGTGNAIDVALTPPPVPPGTAGPAASASANTTSGLGGGPYAPAPMSCSPSDSRGKRMRQQAADVEPSAVALAANPVGLSPPAAAAATMDASTGATVDMRPSSPSSRSQSVGDPMSIPCADGATVYAQVAGYPYPYGMPPSYALSYGMPYGDPYYHSGYGYSPMMDAPPPPGSAVPSDALAAAGYGGPVGSHSAQMPYPGYMAPRQRLYRRFLSGQNSRRDGANTAPESTAAAVGSGQESTAGHPMGSTSGPATGPGAGAAAGMRSSVTAVRQLHGSSVAPQPGPSAPVGLASSGGTAGPADAQPSAGQGVADQASAGGASHSQKMPTQGARPASGGLSSVSGGADVDIESSMAARACHEQFAADDMPLPLPRSTVDGIRQELRVVTQEFLQRRMDLARTKQMQAVQAQAQAQAAAGNDGTVILNSQPSSSWAAGDPLSGMSVSTGPSMMNRSHSYNPYQQHAQHSGLAQGQAGDAYLQGAVYPSSMALATAGSGGGGGGCGGSSTSLPHKRGASMGLSAGGAVSPVRARPAPTAPAAVMVPLAHSRGGAGATSIRRNTTDGFNNESMTAGPTQLTAGGTVGTAAVPAPNAMRQLFPPPTGGTGGGGGGGGGHPAAAGGGPGTGTSNGITAGGSAIGKPQAAAATVAAPAASAPLGPRPAMSGKSSASATHSVSVAQTAPVRSVAHQQQQNHQQQQLLIQKGGAPVGMGSYRVGQQGSMAAEVEDDGEEVHGPPQRNSMTRPMGPSVVTSSSTCGPPSAMPMPPNYYGGAVPPTSYDYPPSYYYPPSIGSYNMRMYGMPPPNVPQGYRPPPSSSMPMYGMPPPAMSYGNGGAITPSWSDYAAPLMPVTAMPPQPGSGGQMHPGSGGTMPSGPSGSMSMMHMRSSAAVAVGTGSGNDYIQPAPGR